MSLSDTQIDTILSWVDGGALQGDPKDLPAPLPIVTTNEWQAVRDGFGPPDLVVKSEEYTMPAVHQDAWWRPTSDIPLTEPRWVKMVEIRPTSLQARKVIHHSIAYLQLNDDPEAVSQGTATRSGWSREPGRPRQSPPAVDGVGDRQGLRRVPQRHRQASAPCAARSPGMSTSTRLAKTSRRVRKSASGFIRKARSPSTAATSLGSPALIAARCSTSGRTPSRTRKVSPF